MCMKFRVFQKKDGCPSLIISEIIMLKDVIT